MFSFFVPGQPMGKGRPRHRDKITYTPRKTKNYEELVKSCFKNKYEDAVPIGEKIGC